MLSESMHNYPDGYKEKPWCPSTKLVQICASLAGVELTPETFCTEELSNARYSEGTIHWFETGDFYPKASCVKVNQILVQQIDIIGKKIELPGEENIAEEIRSANSTADMLVVTTHYTQLKEDFGKRETILNRWRDIIFQTCCSTTSDEKNEYFRQFKTASELPEEEIIDRVKQFTSALNKITEYIPRAINLGCGAAKNCPQSPRVYHYRRNS